MFAFNLVPYIVNQLPYSVVLASASPRRKELLGSLIPEFETCVSNVDEEAVQLTDPWEMALTLAQQKAEAVQANNPNHLIIAGDTVVALPVEDGRYQQLAKPADFDDAARMLQLLSAKTHLVITGICLAWKEGIVCEAATSKVTFRRLSEAEIRDYVSSGEPMDKAGAYAIQAGGGTFVQSVEGSQSNVIGLPLELLESLLHANFPESFPPKKG